MPPSETSWDFGPVLDLIDSDSTLVESPTHRPRTKLYEDVHVAEGAAEKSGFSLGSFARLWENLGINIEEPLPEASLIKATQVEKQGQAVGTIPSTLPEHVADFKPPSQPDTVDATTRCSMDQPGESSSDNPYAGMSKKQRQKARKKANEVRLAEQQSQKEQTKLNKQRATLKARLVQSVQDPVKIKFPKVESSQVNTRSRSNVGAKIRPATPPPTNISISIQQPQHAPIPARTEPFTPTSDALQYRLATDMDLASLPRVSTLAPPNPISQPYSANQVDPITRAPKQVASFPQTPAQPSWEQQHGFPPQNHVAGPSIRRPYPTTPNATPALANINVSLHSQFATGGAPYPYSTPLPPGFQTPINGYTNFQTPQAHAPMQYPLQYGLVPSSVQPAPGTSKKSKKAVPTRAREDRNIEFLQRLIFRFPEDKKWLGALMPYKPSDKVSPAAIHVFIDASNILIGFNQTRGMAGLPRCDMSFDALAFLLERRRPVTKRVYSSSTRLSAPILSNEKFNDLAGDVGYEKNIYEQVYKTKELTERQKFFQDVNRLGYSQAIQKRQSGSGSDSETGPSPSKHQPPPTPKWVEQGVDESLHLKMCQSIIDCEVPSTMVLATGDGAEAEYSDGFLAHVERALKNGWTVELVSWKQQTNGGYKNKRFKAKWGDRFRIIELDDFMEFMVDDA